MTILEHIFLLLLGILIAVVLRSMFLIYQILTTECKLQTEKPLRTIVCIGSGGHTSEMLRLVKGLDLNKYSPRLYLMADNDYSSEPKVCQVESRCTNYVIKKIPRSRNIQQSYFTSFYTTLYASIYTLPILFNFKPNIILCNGPGTCVPICVLAFVLKCFFLNNSKIVYIESICRVRTLSLTGKIIQFIVDLFIVQWPQLRNFCFNAKYYGRLS